MVFREGRPQVGRLIAEDVIPTAGSDRMRGGLDGLQRRGDRPDHKSPRRSPGRARSGGRSAAWSPRRTRAGDWSRSGTFRCKLVSDEKGDKSPQGKKGMAGRG